MTDQPIHQQLTLSVRATTQQAAIKQATDRGSAWFDTDPACLRVDLATNAQGMAVGDVTVEATVSVAHEWRIHNHPFGPAKCAGCGAEIAVDR